MANQMCITIVVCMYTKMRKQAFTVWQKMYIATYSHIGITVYSKCMKLIQI